MIEFVKKYNSIGLSCLPCKLDKSPLLAKSWSEKFELNEFENAKAIGIKCGKESQGLECIDIDNHSGTAKENLILFIDQIKYLYDKYNFPVEKTQGGGYHFLYKCDEIDGNQKLASVPKLNDQKKWIPDAIFETRGEGGYFLAYPSPGYNLIKNDIFNIPTITKEERKEILSICRSFNTFAEPIYSEFERSEKPGDIYNQSSDSIHEAKSLLESKGWKENKKGYWTRPGKKEGISASFGKVAENVFYVWSSSAYPFEMEKAYTPFQIKALLEFNGNFPECARNLVEKLGLKKDKPFKKQQIKKTEKEYSELIKNCYINLNIQIDKPPVALYISDLDGLKTIRKRMLTLGNFSCVIGKSKSRKTFLTTMLTAAIVSGNGLFNKFWGSLPNNKKSVGYFDTEQGDYDAANNIKRIHRLIGQEPENFAGFNLRSLSYLDRCEIVEQFLKEYAEHIGLIVIDGIADLAKAINDEEEATRIVTLLMRWSKDYNCHIITVLHQNKNDNFATGHLGSFIMKKAEMIISVTKDKGSRSDSIVACDYSRGIDFDEFSFNIENGLPFLTSNHYETQIIETWNY